MRLIFDAHNAVRNHRLNNCSARTMRLFITIGNRWTKLSVQLKRLNGESARAPLIDLLQVLKLSWDDPNSFLPHPASQGNVRASRNRERQPSLPFRKSSPELRVTWK
jgi:hypothetical protein